VFLADGMLSHRDGMDMVDDLNEVRNDSQDLFFG
jgi:hypothetical protein